MIRTNGILHSPFDRREMWDSPVIMPDARFCPDSDTGELIVNITARMYYEDVTDSEDGKSVVSRKEAGSITWYDQSLPQIENISMSMKNLNAALEFFIVEELQSFDRNINLKVEFV